MFAAAFGGTVLPLLRSMTDVCQFGYGFNQPIDGIPWPRYRFNQPIDGITFTWPPGLQHQQWDRYTVVASPGFQG